ncbi:MAG TPA: hypothetical protein P5180_04885 [Bacteroidales bacterium]|nr:hypothetical protein [Bacteroidales bacterium]
MARSLRAGNLSMIYENGALRYISSGTTELLRMIYPAIRDVQWLTVAPVTQEELIEDKGNEFTIKLHYLYCTGEISFRAHYLIEGIPDGTIIFSMTGEALNSFRKNRIGLCVLHPVEECAGNTCVIEHAGGSVESSIFPVEISPHQVFRDIREMRWMSKGITCSLSFEGDVFETEDQRNWTDASFKTYSTPLSMPFPVTVDIGTKISQKVVFKASGLPVYKDGQTSEISIHLYPDRKFDLPRFGICSSSSGPLHGNALNIIRALHPDHLRYDFHLYDHSWKETAHRCLTESSDLGVPPELALFFDDSFVKQKDAFISWYTANKSRISSIIVLHRDLPATPGTLACELIPLIRELIPDAKTATGTNANFAELNRNRPPDYGNDYLCFAVHPQEHASDDRTLIENLKAQEYAIKSAKIFADGKDIMISPLTFHRRLNANVSFIELPGHTTVSESSSDIRFSEMFGACWCAGSLKYISEAGAASLTCFETTGKKGLMEKLPVRHGSSVSYREIIHPVYFTIRFFIANRMLEGIKSVSSSPLSVDSIVLTDGRKVKAMLVNFTSSVQKVNIECCKGLFRATSLDNSNYEKASSSCRWTGAETDRVISSADTFNIEPHSVNFIDGWLKH